MIYEYRCPKCEHEFEMGHRITEEFGGPCPKCNWIGEFERLISSSTFLLKGDGWSKDGYSEYEGKCNRMKKKIEEAE
jgi:putative FmdB family regulatory protein